MNILKKILGIFALSLLVWSCNQQQPKETEAHEEAAHHENEEAISLTKAQIEAIGIEFGQIEQKELTHTIKANGHLSVPNQSRAQVTSLYSGQVKALYIRPGDYVKKGEVLAVIENPNQVLAQEQYLTVVEQIRMAKIEADRQRMLYEGNAGALKNWQYAKSRLKDLQIQKASWVKQLQMMGINPAGLSRGKMQSTMAVRAPISGVIGHVLVAMGAYVDMATPLANIVDNSNLHLDLNVFEKDLGKVHKGQTIHFTLTNNPGKEYDAKIFSIGSTFEDESKAIPVHASVKGDKTGLIDGMSVVALISIGRNLVPSVPSEAIVNEGAKDFIFIQQEVKEHAITFKKIPVAKGVTDIGYTQITPLEKVPQGAKVATKGAFFILAKASNTGEHGHAH